MDLEDNLKFWHLKVSKNERSPLLYQKKIIIYRKAKENVKKCGVKVLISHESHRSPKIEYVDW